MPDLMREKLGLYLDGEMRGHSQLEVQAHLETCQDCRDELDELRRLSRLLHAAPLPEFTPASRFTSQLMLQLPRRVETPRPRVTAQWLGWLAPTALLVTWVFIQVTLRLASVISLAQQGGLLGETAAWISPSLQQMQWFTVIQAVFGNSLSLGGLTRLEFLNDAGLLLQNLVGPFIWQIAMAIMYWAWMAIWWQSRQRQQPEKIALH